MSAKPNRKPSLLLGIVLLIVLLAVVTVGGYAAVTAAFQPRMSTSRAAAELAAAQSAAQQVTPQPTNEPEPETEPEPEPEPQPETPTTSRVTLMALGDNLIHNCVYWSAETSDGGYDFTSFYDDIRPIVAQYDLACINQETILVQDRSLIASYPVFGSPVEVADALADAGFDVVTLASNHCYDKAETGVQDTLSYFRENYPEITTLGIHDTQEDAEQPVIVEKNGIRIAMLNFTYGLNNDLPTQSWMVDRLTSTDDICARVTQARQQADFVIVFPHWGTEDALEPSESQQTLAQALADAGADLILGTHTHTLQPTQLLTAADGRDVPVYYSLGNFLSHQKETINLLGGMASVTIVKDADGTHVEEYDLKATVNLILRNPNSGWYDYRPMLLDNYSAELAAQNRFEACTVETMTALFEQVEG